MEQTIFYDSGRYEGEVKDGKPNGRGIFFGKNSSRFEGEFRNGQPNGHGFACHPNGSRSEGEFKDGKPIGQLIQYPACKYFKSDESQLKLKNESFVDKSAICTFEKKINDKKKSAELMGDTVVMAIKYGVFDASFCKDCKQYT